ncbi:LysR substrate binding domain protein [compost metagenome]
MSEKLVFNDLELMTTAVMSGAGVAQLADYQITSYIASGRLVAIMQNFEVEGGGHYLCYQGGRKMPTRTRVVIDYFLECFNVHTL